MTYQLHFSDAGLLPDRELDCECVSNFSLATALSETPFASITADDDRGRLDDLLEIHEYERQRLGQELHDSTGQLVISLLLGLGRLKAIDSKLGQGPLIGEIEQTARQIEKEIRSLAFLHYPAELGDRSLPASIESLALGFGRRTGLDTTFECPGSIAPIDRPLSTALLRITQEALVNVHRHARARSVKVQLKCRSNVLRLQVCDDGIGMHESAPASASNGIGLQGMRHRIEARRGRFEVRNLSPGLMIRATVPVTL